MTLTENPITCRGTIFEMFKYSKQPFSSNQGISCAVESTRNTVKYIVRRLSFSFGFFGVIGSFVSGIFVFIVYIRKCYNIMECVSPKFCARFCLECITNIGGHYMKYIQKQLRDYFYKNTSNLKYLRSCRRRDPFELLEKLHERRISR